MPDVEVGSSTRAPKLVSCKMKEDKWSITKTVSMDKKAHIRENWGWGLDRKVKIEGGISVLGNYLSEFAMMSLSLGSWIDGRIIYLYMV